MGKRFTDCDKWTKNKWFRTLSNENKLFWLFMLDNCDSVGVWEEDIDFASLMIGFEYSMESVLEMLGNRIKIINEGKKWWIKDFCHYQYGHLDEERISNKPHQSYISRLKHHSLWIDYTKTIQRHKEKEKEKDIDKEKEKEQKFESIWLRYPRKDSKKESLSHFRATVNTAQNWSDINKALDNYLSSLKENQTEPKYIKNGKTWFNNWQDWIDYKEPETNKNNPVIESPKEAPEWEVLGFDSKQQQDEYINEQKRLKLPRDEVPF